MRIVPVFAGFVIILFCAPVVQAQINKDYSFSLCPQSGLFYGKVEEIVYPDAEYKADLLSLLIWDIKPVFYYGLLMEFSPLKPMEKSGFFSGLSVKFGIPGLSGDMVDKDWLSVENAELTNFSSHDNITKEIFLFDLLAGFSFPVRGLFFVKTFVNISYMNFRFDGENGYRIYAEDLGSGKFGPIADAPKVPMSGKVISYSQKWFYVSPGVSAGYSYKDLFSAEIFFLITPLVFCSDLDDHIKIDKQFMDKMRGGIMLEPGILLSYNISKLLNISCDISWRYISGTKGPAYKRNSIGTGVYEPAGKAGAGLSILNTALTLKVKL